MVIGSARKGNCFLTSGWLPRWIMKKVHGISPQTDAELNSLQTSFKCYPEIFQKKVRLVVGIGIYIFGGRHLFLTKAKQLREKKLSNSLGIQADSGEIH